MSRQAGIAAFLGAVVKTTTHLQGLLARSYLLASLLPVSDWSPSGHFEVGRPVEPKPGGSRFPTCAQAANRAASSRWACWRRESESSVFCRNREANIPDSIDYTSLLGHYSVTTISYSVGARIGAHLSCPPIVCLKQGREVASALLAAHLAVTTGRRDRGRTPPVATCGNRGSEVTRRK
jgi:hypothetical protein